MVVVGRAVWKALPRLVGSEECSQETMFSHWLLAVERVGTW